MQVTITTRDSSSSRLFGPTRIGKRRRRLTWTQTSWPAPRSCGGIARTITHPQGSLRPMIMEGRSQRQQQRLTTRKRISAWCA